MPCSCMVSGLRIQRAPQRAERAGALRRGAGLCEHGGGQAPGHLAGHEAGAGGNG